MSVAVILARELPPASAYSSNTPSGPWNSGIAPTGRTPPPSDEMTSVIGVPDASSRSVYWVPPLAALQKVTVTGPLADTAAEVVEPSVTGSPRVMVQSVSVCPNQCRAISCSLLEVGEGRAERLIP